MSNQRISLGNYEMLKAIYDFQATFAKTLSFHENDYFLLHQTSTRQRNWWQAVNEKGQIGFVPSNYVVTVHVTPQFMQQFLDNCISSLKAESSRIGISSDKQELILRLSDKKRQIELSFLPPSPPLEFRNEIPKENEYKSYHTRLSDSHDLVNIRSPSSVHSSFSESSLSCRNEEIINKRDERNKELPNYPKMEKSKSEEKPNSIENEQLPIINRRSSSSASRRLSNEMKKSPDEFQPTPQKAKHYRKSTNDLRELSKSDLQLSSSDTSQQDNLISRQSSEHRRSRSKSENRRRSSAASSSQASLNVDIGPRAVYQLLEQVRKNTQLSHEMSKIALITVVEGIKDLLPMDLKPYLTCIAQHTISYLNTPESFIYETHDANRLKIIFTELTSCKDDSQQRSWMLHEDEGIIKEYLMELISILSNADANISKHVLSSDQYDGVMSLIQYYQMEIRWPIRQLLLQAFGIMCSLDKIVINIMLNSVLPMELARDMRTNPRNITRLNYSALLLTMIFSMGEQMPITHLEHVGLDFVMFLFKHVESPPETDIDEQIPDLFLNLILSYNLQFNDDDENVVMLAAGQLGEAKIFAEKNLLLLNREEDPVRIFDHQPAPVNSVLKMFTDLLNHEFTASLFYTNDIKVLIDIIIRQLSDLSPGDSRRQQYLELCRRLLRNTNYNEHFHRKDDILKCFTRIFCEETDVSYSDQQLVRKISNEFPHYFKT